MMTRLATRAALWGLALGLLAPTTTVLVLISGLAAPGTGLTTALDARFFFLYLPVAMAVVTVGLSLNGQYRRNLTAAVTAIGAVALVKLRLAGGTVTDSELRDAWLIANGSLVLHVLVMWALLGWALRDLGRYQVDPPEAVDDRLPPSRRDTAVVGLALASIAWGAGIGAAAGGAVGTVLFPVVGTLAGAFVGALYALVPAGGGALLLSAIVAYRRPSSVAELRHTVDTVLTLVGLATMAWAWIMLTDLAESTDVVLMWLLVLAIVWPLLAVAGRRLTSTYVGLARRRRERLVLATP